MFIKHGIAIVAALVGASAAEARIDDAYDCGSGLKIKYLNKAKEKDALEDILTSKRSTLATGTGTALSTDRLEQYRQGMGWFGIGALHPGSFEYRIDYDGAAGPRRYVVQVRNLYNKLVPGDLTFPAAGGPVTLRQFVSNATETDQYNDRQQVGNQVYVTSALNTYYLSRYEVTEADFRRIADLPPDSRLMSDQAVGQYGVRDKLRMCKVTLLPMEFRYVLAAIDRARNGPSKK